MQTILISIENSKHYNKEGKRGWIGNSKHRNEERFENTITNRVICIGFYSWKHQLLLLKPYPTSPT